MKTLLRNSVQCVTKSYFPHIIDCSLGSAWWVPEKKLPSYVAHPLLRQRGPDELWVLHLVARKGER